MMWFLLFLCIAQLEQVITQGDNRLLILENGNNACEGYVKIRHGNSWGYVGDKYWNSSTEKVVCKSAHCGKPVGKSTDVPRPTDVTDWLNEVKCNGDEDHLLDCKYPGWKESYYGKLTVKKIKCSNNITIKFKGFECAGAVLYSTGGESSGHVCADNWGKGNIEAEVLCKSLGCGNSGKVEDKWMVWGGSKTSKNMKIKCTDNQRKNLWQCAKEESPSCSKPASVICSNHKRLQLRGNTSNVCSGKLEIEKGNTWTEEKPAGDPGKLNKMCEQMYCGTYKTLNGTQLTCSDNVEVALKDNLTSCYGTVHIKVNDSSHPVCASSSSSSLWNDKNAEMVCKELKCGKLTESRTVPPTENGIMDYVECTGSESSLWHCKAKHETEPFACKLNAYVVCSESIKVRLKDGPGKCAGRLEIMYDGKWKKVNNKDWTADNSNAVCKELKCGNSRQTHSTEEFGPGLNEFLDRKFDCKPNATRISDCETEKFSPSDNKEVGITCEEHKVIFLEGNNSCSGEVGIEQGDNTYWLSGSKKTWNKQSADTVCQQKHCGTVRSFNNTSRDNKTYISKTSYSCSSKKESLFDCETDTLPLDHNDTIATVDCTGEISITLANFGWGNVDVCVGGKCGGVCKDTWTDTKSSKLCKQQGYGKASATLSEPGVVFFKSMHILKKNDNLNKSTFVRNDNDPCTNKAQVVCSGSIKPRLQSSRDKCSGNLEIKFKDEWLPVCKTALTDKNVQNTICEELGCGSAVNTIDYFGRKSDKTHAISKLQCGANKSLTECDVSRDVFSCAPVGLQCSDWKKITLNKACSGPVFLLSEGENPIAVSRKGFTEEVGIKLCEVLNCSSYVGQEENNYNKSLWNGSFNCADAVNPKNIWDCYNKSQQPSELNKWLSIKCEGEPNVTLSGKCKGEVKINGDEVCNTNWNQNYSHKVCQEQNCGNAFGDPILREAKSGKEYYHVNCEEYHHTLGQCKRFKGPCDQRLVSVYCVGSFEFSTTEKCGGQLKVNYRNKWEKVCPVEGKKITPKDFQQQLCESINCTSDEEPENPLERQKLENLETSLDCKGSGNIKHCVVQKSCEKQQPAEIYCKGYVAPKKQPEPSNVPVVPIILGVGFLLVLVILIVVFVRICIIKKAKNVTSRIFSRKEVEFESGDVEDFHGRGNEMAEFGHGRGFRSEAEFFEEHDRRSNSSFSYDDIDEADEARALTSQAGSTGTSGDNYIPESALDQNGVTYEVEDPQENYDDIEASPENTQTRAEVHDGPKTTPEKEAVIAGLVQGDEDYLVPGQDG